ncbi:MAG TPA: DUF2807 domain-containing protein [Rhizomicrobium sp.]|nr:DUF2807 domain-containing protein [Rhizomicrobium sp.]
MSRRLMISSITGLVLCALFLGLARAIGGDDVFHDARALGEMKPLIDLASHKSWRWNGGDSLALDAPINIRYQPQALSSGIAQVSLVGPAELLQHVKVSDGRITADTSVTRASGKKVEAIVSGAPIRKFVVNGGENLDLGEINQQNLDLHLNGGGTVSGRGKVDQLNLTISGPGEAKLGGLMVLGDARVSILGSGDATLSPLGRVKLFIAGSGDLHLLTKPAELRQTIIGSGDVNQLSGAAAQAALKSVEVSRIASEAANEAIRASLGDNRIGEIAAQAARAGIANADIDRHVREGIAQGLAQASIDLKTGNVTLRDYKDVDLGHVERESLTVTIAASGSLTANGKVDRLTVNVMGSGHANLGKLAARSVSVSVMGSGEATVAPSQDLKVDIMGSGDVHLTTHPAQIQRSIMGSGRVIEER